MLLNHSWRWEQKTNVWIMVLTTKPAKNEVTTLSIIGGLYDTTRNTTSIVVFPMKWWPHFPRPAPDSWWYCLPQYYMISILKHDTIIYYLNFFTLVIRFFFFRFVRTQMIYYQYNTPWIGYYEYRISLSPNNNDIYHVLSEFSHIFIRFFSFRFVRIQIIIITTKNGLDMTITPP